MEFRGRKNLTVEERLRLQSVVDPTTGCRLMTKKSCGDGYCQVRVKGKLRLAHVVSYELSGRVIPDGMFLDHTCSRRSCIEPAHLEPVTREENNRRSFQRGLKVYVPRKLTAEQAFEIRRIYSEDGLTQKEIAELFGVSRTHVTSIISGDAWGT